MATITITEFSLVRDVGNGTFTLTYDVVFDDFDRATNLPYRETWKFIEDDTGFDNDLDAPDDLVGLTVGLTQTVKADGRDKVSRTRTKTVAWVDLDLDSNTWAAPEEFRGSVTLTPVLPAAVTKESEVALVDVVA